MAGLDASQGPRGSGYDSQDRYVYSEDEDYDLIYLKHFECTVVVHTPPEGRPYTMDYFGKGD